MIYRSPISQSVAHMPMKAMIYKTLSTVVDGKSIYSVRRSDGSCAREAVSRKGISSDLQSSADFFSFVIKMVSLSYH